MRINQTLKRKLKIVLCAVLTMSMLLSDISAMAVSAKEQEGVVSTAAQEAVPEAGKEETSSSAENKEREEQTESSPSKESEGSKESKESADSADSDESIEPKESIESKESAESRESIESKESVESKESKESVESKELKEENKKIELEERTLREGSVVVKGLLPKRAVLKVEPVAIKDVADKVEDGQAILCAYDISIMVDKEEYTIDESVKVTIEVPEDVSLENVNDEDLTLLHVDDNEEVEKVEASVVSDDKIEFEAKGFSTYVVVVNGKSITVDYVEAAPGKTFNQPFKINFADASLVNKDADSVKVQLYGNINGDKVKLSNGTETTEPIAIGDPITLSGNSWNYSEGDEHPTAYLTGTFNGIDVYVKGRTGDATAGGNGLYEIPPEFYGIKVEEGVEGYTPRIVSNGYAKLSPVKDENDARWSTSTITIENDIQALSNPNLTVEWEDNRNFAGVRPYSNGTVISNAEAVAAGVELFYKSGDEYIKVENNSAILVKSGSNVPKVTSLSFNSWNVSFKSLPKADANGTDYEWYVRFGDGFFNDGTDRRAYYKASTNDYLSINDAGSTKIVFSYSDAITGTLKWNIEDETKIPAAPAAVMLGSMGMKLMSSFPSKDANGDDIILTQEVTSGFTIEWNCTDNKSWEYSIKGLPFYNSAGDAITYYVVMNSTYDNNGTTFHITYNNGAYSADTDKCYSGHIINATITGEASFGFNKVWLDGNDVDRRKSAIAKGITLYLWRYPKNMTEENGAPVTKDAKQYTYTLTEADAGDGTNNTTAIMLNKFSGSDSLAKYDELGYEYVYYVTEVSSSELYRTVYYNGDAAYAGSSNDTSTRNGGQLINVRNAKLSPELIKTWNVSAVPDYSGSECSFELQKKEGENWVSVGNKTLSGFSSSKKSVTGAFDPVDFYDGLGERIEYRVIQTLVKTGSNDTSTETEAPVKDDNTGEWKSVYRLKGYTYSSISNIESEVADGVELARLHVTDQLYGNKDLKVTKTWNGAWGIGSGNNLTYDVTLKIKRSVEGSNSSEDFATLRFTRPNDANELSGTGTIALEDTSATPDDNTFTVSNDGKTWTASKITVPAYTDTGIQYLYTLVEEVPDAVPEHFYNELNKEVDGENISLSISNNIGTGSVWTRLFVSNVWQDDSDTAQRGDIKVEVGTYDASFNFTPVTSDNERYKNLILNAGNDYSRYIWVNGEDFMTDAEKTAYEAAEESNKPALRNQAIAAHMSIRITMADSNGVFNRVVTNPTFEDGKIKGSIAAAGDRPGYKVSIAKDNSNSFTLTSTRVAKRSYTFNKTWVDSDNILGLRGDFLRVVLLREENGVDTEVDHIDLAESSGNTARADFTNSGAYYPAYDEEGHAYSYSFKEYICKGDPSDPVKKEVKTTATSNTTTTGYVVNVSDTEYGNTIENDVLLMNETIGYTNKAAGLRDSVAFYSIWNDEAESTTRPDVHFSLYYKVGESELTPYTGTYTERWEAVEVGNKYIQKAVFTGLPAADDNGNVYVYYVRENLNNAKAHYDTKYYDLPLFDGNDYNYNVFDQSIKNSKNKLQVQNGVAESALTGYTKEGSFITNTLSDTINIEGRKLWQNIPDGIEADKLPAAEIYLFRESYYDKTKIKPNKPDTSSATDKDDALNIIKNAFRDAAIEYTVLNNDKSKYAFTDGNTDNLKAFPKYDEYGGLYEYKVEEVIINKYDHELPAEIMIPHYQQNSMDIANYYKLDEGTNVRSITVNKQWNVRFNDQELDQNAKNAKATFRLYRRELSTDDYARDDSDSSDPASSAKAASDFNITSPDTELVDEKVITRETTTFTWSDLKIFAPDGSIYAYYVVEMTNDMPGYSVNLNSDNSGVSQENGAKIYAADSKNVEIHNNALGENSYFGVAVSNKGISLSNAAQDNSKEETFSNTYNVEGFKKITFTKNWITDNGGYSENFSSMIPGIDDTQEALGFEVKAKAATQAGKGNAETVDFSSNSYTVSKVCPDPANAPNIWNYTITFDAPVPFYSPNGNLYTYYVSEGLHSQFAQDNYKTVASTVSKKANEAAGSDNNGRILAMGELKNRLNGSFTVSKRWDDFSNDYGLREGSIKFSVYYRAGDVGNWSLLSENNELSGSNGWKKTFSGLPVTVNNSGNSGAKYQYRVVETSIEPSGQASITVADPVNTLNYSQTAKWRPNGSNNDDAANFYTPVEAGNYLVYDPADITDISSSPTVKIVNQLDTTRAVVTLDVTKTWDDEGDKYGLRPGTIQVRIDKSTDNGSTWSELTKRTLSSDDAAAGDPDTWRRAFTNLPKYYGTGADQIYVYRAVEISLEGAAATLDSGFAGTGGAYNIAHVFAGGHTTDGNGIFHYATNITNTLRHRSGDINVRKLWNDQAVHSEEVDVKLLSKNYLTGSDDSTSLKAVAGKDGNPFKITLSGSSYEGSFSDLPSHNKSGNLITYYVQEGEALLLNYTAEYYKAGPSGDFSAVTNKTASTNSSTDEAARIIIVNTPRITVSGSKEWDDDNDKYHLRGDVNVKIQRKEASASDDTYTDVSVSEYKRTKPNANAVTATLKESNSYRAAFDDLAKYKLGNLELSSGTISPVKYIYRITETSGPSSYSATGVSTAPNVTYSATVEDNNGNQSNTITNRLETRAGITVEKIWNSGDAEKQLVNVSLLSRNFGGGDDNGTGSLTEIQSGEITAASEWKISINDLPAYNKDGKEIVYYVQEQDYASAQTIYKAGENLPTLNPADKTSSKTTGKDKTLYVQLTNTPYTSAEVSITWADQDNKYKTRPDKQYVLLQRSSGNGAFTDVKWSDIADNAGAAGKGDALVVLELSGSNNWTGSLDKLTLYQAYSGTPVSRYSYRFIECNGSGVPEVPYGYTLNAASEDYTHTTDGSESGYAFSFTTDPQTTAVTNTLITKDHRATKIWDDTNNRLLIRPVSVKLLISEETTATGGFNANIPSDIRIFNLTGTGNTWSHTYTNLPKYSYGSDKDIALPKEAVYKVAEDVDSADANGFVLKNYYDTAYRQLTNETEITNKVKSNDGTLIVGKKITSSTNQPSKPFTFDVTLTRPDGSDEKFTGNYFIYEMGTEQIDPEELRTNAVSRSLADSKKAANGIIELPAGYVAVLVDINSQYKYSVKETVSYEGYKVTGIEHNNNSIADNVRAEYTAPNATAAQIADVRNATENTRVEFDTTSGTYYGEAKGAIPSADKNPASVIFTNSLITVKDLKIENTSELAKGTDGELSSGGQVKVYHPGIAVNTEGQVNTDAYAYTNIATPFVSYALTVQFTPDTAKGFSFGDDIRILWWNDTDDLNASAPNSVVISGYTHKNAAGEEVPYTGKLVKEEPAGDGQENESSGGPSAGPQTGSNRGGSNDPDTNDPDNTDPASDRQPEETVATDPEFNDIWTPILQDTPFKQVTVMQGSVVLTLAGNSSQMPARTLVQVSFKAPEIPVAPSPALPSPVVPSPGQPTPVKPENTDDMQPGVSPDKKPKNEPDFDVDTPDVDEVKEPQVTKLIKAEGIKTGDEAPIKALLVTLILLMICFASVLSLLLIYNRKKS